MKIDSPRVRFAALLARLDRLQMYNRTDAQGLAQGRAAAHQVAAALRTTAAELSPAQRRRALAAHVALHPRTSLRLKGIGHVSPRR